MTNTEMSTARLNYNLAWRNGTRGTWLDAMRRQSIATTSDGATGDTTFHYADGSSCRIPGMPEFQRNPQVYLRDSSAVEVTR